MGLMDYGTRGLWDAWIMGGCMMGWMDHGMDGMDAWMDHGMDGL